MTHKDEFEHGVKLDVEARVRQGVKAVLEHLLEAGYRELTPTRKGECNGHYQRNLVTPAGRIERLEVPRDREGEFVTEVFERYKRLTGNDRRLQGDAARLGTRRTQLREGKRLPWIVVATTDEARSGRPVPRSSGPREALVESKPSSPPA